MQVLSLWSSSCKGNMNGYMWCVLIAVGATVSGYPSIDDSMIKITNDLFKLITKKIARASEEDPENVLLQLLSKVCFALLHNSIGFFVDSLGVLNDFFIN
ncbi:hypothetical protein Tcan_00062 [Toxocara canis]|uniref:Uncharacterized protein n=1 Tax=Toxocara canis TaxID=6265 RepID=A0A0B2VXF9_TOXCA|nr:hypothetical protein Tcan_00062 [Toxocara canis]